MGRGRPAAMASIDAGGRLARIPTSAKETFDVHELRLR